MSVPSRAIRATPIGTRSPSTSPEIPYRRLCSKKSTGLSSRIADRSRPFASAGVAGVTIFSPGTPMNQDAGIWEWIAPNRPPAPTTERITSGTLTCSPLRNQYLRRLVDEAVHRERQEVAEHDLDHGTESGDRRSERGPGERELRDRRVEDALPPVLLVQPRGHGEHATRERDVLAEEDDAIIRGQLLVERLAQGGAEVDRRRSVRSWSRSIEDEGKRMLEQLSQAPEESRGVGAVDRPVVGRQREIRDVPEARRRHRRSRPGAVAPSRPRGSPPAARIDHGGERAHVEHAQVRDRERRRRELLDRESLGPEPSRRARASRTRWRRAASVGVDDRGHQQRILRGHGDADVHPAVALAPSVDERAVERGVLPQRQRHGLDDEVVHATGPSPRDRPRRGGAG